jgi:hypothetical protein
MLKRWRAWRSRSSAARFMSTPMHRIHSGCCARARREGRCDRYAAEQR